MMLHRHFEEQRNENITTLADVTPKEKSVSEELPHEEEPVEAPKRRGRPKKTED
ncbi:MAG: hypothetical protein J6S14_02085 [Clostridia bacterium]|nr:hypothetical protein [Clostridia bacterium]